MTGPRIPPGAVVGHSEPGDRAGSGASNPGPATYRHHGPHPSSAADPARTMDPVVDDAALDAVMKVVPRGALALAATALGLMLVGWLLLYFLVFLSRESVA